MPGPPPKPDGQRIRRGKPALPWLPTSEVGWQHGEIPKPPPKLTAASREAWQTWFTAWFASHWDVSDVPAIRQVIRLYDEVERGVLVRHAELRMSMDTLGISQKGQQMRRWQPPKPVEEEQPVAKPAPSRYEHLRSVSAS